MSDTRLPETRPSIATVCLSGTLEEKLHASAEAGFEGVEIFESDLVVSPHSPQQVRALADRLALRVEMYQPFRDFEGVGPELLAANLRRAEAKFRLMHELGTDLLLVCSNVATATYGEDAVAVDQLRRLGDLAARYDIRIAYEALAWGRYVNDVEHAHRIIAAVDHPNVGHGLDSFHMLSRGWDPAVIEQIPAGKIFFAQLADAPRLTMDVLTWSRHHRVFPGEGAFDLGVFVGHLLRAGYTGPLSLEVFNDVFRQADPFRTAVDGRRALIWVEEQAARWLARKGAGGVRVQLPALPPAEQPRGFDFAEVRSTEPEPLRTTLRQLGFHDAGDHRTKPVELWRQGEARLVLSRQAGTGGLGEPRDPAPVHTGEPRIAALGFDVTDPLRASARALHLLAQAVPRAQEADEEVLQAVRAPDGTEVFFARRGPDGEPRWTVEFAAGHADAAGLITRIDHVNLAQPWQHFDEAVLFYESTLALDPQPSVDVAAPGGLVRSQVMQSTDRSVRLALNVAPLGDGPSVIYPQHVAFASTDVRALARQAAARGLPFLKIPANYYDDLEARFGLSADFLAELRELNLLYDRDADGDFLHFYTETIGQVFFEVVERRAGYDGYGAPNAPVRLAAQHRRRREREHDIPASH